MDYLLYKIICVKIFIIQIRKVKFDSILFYIGYLALFDFIFVRLPCSYGLSELVLSFCYQRIVIIQYTQKNSF
jgi:hypothetical protein